MKTQILAGAILLGHVLMAQTPEDAILPDKFRGLEKTLIVGNFPSPVLASRDPEEAGAYFWKHNTSILSEVENITIVEGGAYIFYNKKWNLRVSMSSKDFSKLFKVPKGRMQAGEPYTFAENWRRDSRLVGGWAMWYVIGETDDGKTVYGIGKLDTVGELYSSKN